MSDILLYPELFKNNTYNHDSMMKTLAITKESSYEFLNNFQLKAGGYKRFDFKASDITSSVPSRDRYSPQYPKKYMLAIKSNFIGESNRLAYKKSIHFAQEVNMNTIANNSELFSNAYLVFVNGKFIDSTTLLCKDESTYIIINVAYNETDPGIPRSYFDELVLVDADITVYFVPNCAYGVLNTNRFALQTYSNKLSLSQFDIAGHLSDDETYITFINENDLLYNSIVTDVINSEQYLRFYDGNDVLPYDNKYIHLNVFGLRNLLEMKTIAAGETFFEIEIQNMPIPKENLIVFRNVNNKKLFAHDIQFEYHYPNIYKIVNNAYPLYELSIFIVYFDDTEVSISKHVNELDLYYKYIPNLLAKYKNDSIEPLIKNYIPKTYQYSINDFIDTTDGQNPLTYKKSIFEEFLVSDFKITKNYFYDLFKNNRDGFYLYAENIDLVSRIRYDNFLEVLELAYQETFSEPRYLFIFRDEIATNYENLRFFIDGIYYVADKIYKDDVYLYYYIPTSLINSNSVIEIERAIPFYFEEIKNFSAIDTFIDVECNNGHAPVYVNDIYLVDVLTNKYLDTSDFTIQVQDLDGSYITITDNNSFKNIQDNFKISLNNVAYVDMDVTIFINKFTQKFFYEIDAGNIEDITVEFPKKVKNHSHVVRVFKNGRMMPPSAFTVDFGEYYTYPLVSLMIEKVVGDIFLIEVTPNKYTEILKFPIISTNGIVDMGLYLNKAFDLKYHDVFLNGRKLNRTHIDVLTPFKIRVKNVNSLRNFNLIEKDIDNPVFYDYTLPITITEDEILQLTPVYVAIVAEQPLIVDEEENEIPPPAQQYTAVETHNMYEDELKTLELIDPNQWQLTDAMILMYPNIFTDQPYLINPDLIYIYNTVLDFSIDPNIPFS